MSALAVDGIGLLLNWSFDGLGFLIETLVGAIGEMFAIPISFFSKTLGDHIRDAFMQMAAILALPIDSIKRYILIPIFSLLASLVELMFNCIASTLGALIGLGGVLSGVLLGLMVGAMLSILQFWTEQPVLVPMIPSFRAVTYSTCCEMDSVTQIQRLLRADELANVQPSIEVINTYDDDVIRMGASLNVGLGLEPGVIGEQVPLSAKIQSIWYEYGGHRYAMNEKIDSNVSIDYVR